MESGVTQCGKPWRVVCMDRKHPDGKKLLVLVTRGNEEIAVAVSSLIDEVKSQWFDQPLRLV